MSRIFTKLFIAVALLFGLLNTVLAIDYTGKYKATMKFGGVATGESNEVDATVIYSKDGTYTITFIGFDVSIQMLGDIQKGSASVSELNGTESNNGITFKESSNSIFDIANETLTITKFDATIDTEGKGSGSFTGSKSLGPISLSASCDFTLTKVVDVDTIVTKELEFDDVPFYNKVVDLGKSNDTTKTNNDSSAVGIRLYEKKASFTMTDYEISVAGLSLKQRMVLEDLTYEPSIADDGSYMNIHGKTNMYVDEYNMYVPAEAAIILYGDGKINGTIDITLDMPLVNLNYKITVVLGTAAEGVVIENKNLEYTKTDSFKIKSDSAFVHDSKIYINEEGILIENIHYSIVDQKMTLLIKDYVTAYEDGIGFGPWLYSKIHTATKAEAYIEVKGQVSYFKDVDIDLNISEINTYAINTIIGEPTKFVYGSLVIKDGGPNTNNFIDPEGPFLYGETTPYISMIVDTTGNGLDGYTTESEFNVSEGIYDLVDGYIKTVKLPENDFDEIIKAVIAEAKKGSKSCQIPVIATDKAGNSNKIFVQCWPSIAPVYIEEVDPKINTIRVVADSLTGKASVNIESLAIKYIAKNDSLKKSAITNQEAVAWAIIDGEKVELPTTIELPIGKAEIKYVWVNPYTGKENEATSYITVYDTPSSYAGVSNVANKAVSVVYNNDNLIVNGAKEDTVKVINLSGATVYTGKPGAINLHKGIYIVKVDGKAYKIVVK
ncbi:MAG: hypothetical protein E7077_10290 [Bacteroidales bacterium]|jgi:hypothetical protein|nr:hypothetical protein [Bacteroidales bacterium]